MASWEATRQRCWKRLLLVVLASIVGNLGLCYVGIIFSLPLHSTIIAAAYEVEFGVAFDGWAAPKVVGPFAVGSPFSPDAAR